MLNNKVSNSLDVRLVSVISMWVVLHFEGSKLAHGQTDQCEHGQKDWVFHAALEAICYDK